MLRLNLFYEQQRIQREKDYDPVRLTIVGGTLIILIILVVGAILYFKMEPLRKDIQGAEDQLKKLNAEYEALGKPVDFPRIQAQANAIQNHMEYRTLFATQLDILLDVIPTNCQMRLFKTARGMQQDEKSTPGRKKDAPPIITKTIVLRLEMAFEIYTEARSKVEVLQIRDQLVESFRRESRFRDWVHQVPDESGGSNVWNEVIVASSMADDPKGDSMASGLFEFKLPLVTKYQPRELK